MSDWTLVPSWPGFIELKTIIRTGPGGSDFVQANTEADARLIAAAPDLLAILGYAIKRHREWNPPCIDSGCWCPGAREVVAKAKGIEQQQGGM